MYLVLHNYYVWSYLGICTYSDLYTFKVQMSLKAVHRNSLTGHEARSTKYTKTKLFCVELYVVYMLVYPGTVYITTMYCLW